MCAEVMDIFGYVRETDESRSLAELEAELLPLERYEKPGWAAVSAPEKELRQARSAILARIMSYRWQPSTGRRVQHA